MPISDDEFEKLLRKALEEIEKSLREKEERDEMRIRREVERLVEEQERAISSYLESQRSNTYFSMDPEEVEAYGEEGFRGLFFSLEDALEYAKDIPENIPVMIIETPDGYVVVVMY